MEKPHVYMRFLFLWGLGNGIFREKGICRDVVHPTCLLRCCVSVKIGRELQCFLANGDMGRSCILLFLLQSHAVDSLNSYGWFSAYASCYISIYCIGAERHIELFPLKRLTFDLCSYKEPPLPFLGGGKIAYFSNPITQHIPA